MYEQQHLNNLNYINMKEQLCYILDKDYFIPVVVIINYMYVGKDVEILTTPNITIFVHKN